MRRRTFKAIGFVNMHTIKLNPCRQIEIALDVQDYWKEEKKDYAETVNQCRAEKEGQRLLTRNQIDSMASIVNQRCGQIK